MTVARTNTIQILYSDTDNTDAPSAQTAPLSLSEGELCWQDQGTVGTNGKLWIGDAASGAEFHIGGAGTGAVAGDASNLTGTTLASGVTASSLTSLGTIASLGVTSITMDSSTVTGIDEGTAFTDADDHLMTSGAIKEKIEDYGYGTGSSSSDNVSTALQIGTASSTVVNITSDGGADDVTIPTATTTVAGVMSSAIFDEVAANTLKVTNSSAATSLTGTPSITVATVTATDVNISGDLNVTGTTTQLDSTNTLVKDKEIYLGVAGGTVEGTYTRSSTTMTVTSASHGLATGEEILIVGAGNAITDGVYTVLNGDPAGTFTVTVPTGSGDIAGATAIWHSIADVTNTTASGSGIFVPGADMKSIKWDSTDEWLTSDSLKVTGTITPTSGIVLDGNTITGIDDSAEFTDADDHLMTSGAIKEKIEDYGYGTGSSSSDNVSTTLAQGTTSTTVYNITSDGGADDLAIPTATTSQAGVMSSGQFDAHVLNNAKATNVSTALQIGTASSTVVNITSDGGADDVTIPTATTTVAGVMSSAIFDEVAANTLKVTNTNATRGSLNIDTDDSVTFAGVSSTGLITATHGSGILIKDGTASSATEGGNLQLASDDNGALGIGHRLGVIEFAASEGTSDTLIVGAKIQAVADTAWTTSENGTRLELYTMDANAASELTLTLDSNQLATFAAGITMSGTLSGATLAGGTF